MRTPITVQGRSTPPKTRVPIAPEELGLVKPKAENPVPAEPRPKESAPTVSEPIKAPLESIKLNLPPVEERPAPIIPKLELENPPVPPKPRRTRAEKHLAENSPETIDFAEGTTEISAGYCENWKNLKRVKLPRSLVYIGRNAFRGCEALEEIHFPTGLKIIGDSAFTGCKSLRELDIPGTVTTIGAFAFASCENLEHLRLHTGTITLGRRSFSRCSKLKNFHKRDLPKTVDRHMIVNGISLPDFWEEVFEGSPCAESRASKKFLRRARKFRNQQALMLQHLNF